MVKRGGFGGGIGTFPDSTGGAHAILFHTMSKDEERGPDTFSNPILPGFYPDPSICRVGEEFYLVNSSFSYFPGVPIFHSRDLAHWEQIGHVLDRPSQLDLDGAEHSGGIFAPTIRHHRGTYYLITTNVSKGGNFIVTATRPEGPWSDPFWLANAPGIDPSLFFDDDGSAYYVGTRSAPEGEKYPGNGEIWLQKLDLGAMTLVGESRPLWRGALRDAVWPEGPHIYRVQGAYYLMIAEGGTGHHHAVTIARSRSVEGPYEGNPGNPILTHRHLGRSYPIVNTGHADLVETQNGEWWMVALASRPYGGYFRNLGRETFLMPVQWEDGWPIVSPGSGRVEFSYPLPALPQSHPPLQPIRDDFDLDRLAFVWNMLRTPRQQFWSLTDRRGYLRLKLRPEKIGERACPSFIGLRQQHMDFSAATLMEFQPENEGETAGIALVQSDGFHIRMEIALLHGRKIMRLIECKNGSETTTAERNVSGETICLRVEAHGQEYGFAYGSTEETPHVLAKNVDGRVLSTDVAGGFVGTYVGMFASGNGRSGRTNADFDWFEYRGENRRS
jgi:xylan 1,4-beta-xylosidase